MLTEVKKIIEATVDAEMRDKFKAADNAFGLIAKEAHNRLYVMSERKQRPKPAKPFVQHRGVGLLRYAKQRLMEVRRYLINKQGRMRVIDRGSDLATLTADDIAFMKQRQQRINPVLTAEIQPMLNESTRREDMIKALITPIKRISKKCKRAYRQMKAHSAAQYAEQLMRNKLDNPRVF